MNSYEQVENVRLVRYCQMSIVTIVIYDHLLMLHSEVEYIWKKQWTSSKILYFVDTLAIFCSWPLALCTFIPIPRQICKIGVIFIQWFTSGIVWIVQVILIFRVYAMYRRSKIVAIALALCFVIESILMAWLVMANQLIFQGMVVLAPQNRICGITHVLAYKWAYWVPVISFEFILFILAFRVFFQDVIEIRQLRRRQRVSVLNLVLRDNILYFFIALTTYSATLTVWLTCPPTWWQIPAFYSYNGTTILGCRLILNLCKTFYEDRGRSQASPWESGWLRSNVSGQPS